MNEALEFLELADRQAREGGAALPEAVVHRIASSAGAEGARLGKGTDVLVRWGAGGPSSHRLDLAAGRDAFWLELVGGREPEPSVCLAARVALSSWTMREELKKARFAERRRLWEVESLRAIAEVLGGTLEPARIAETLVMHATALLDARRGEVWLSSSEGLGAAARVAGAAGTRECPDGTCIVAARIGGAILDVEEARATPEGGLLEGARLAVPIVGRSGRLGVVALAEREVRGGLAAFGATDAETLALFASQAAVALENAILHHDAMERQLLERELELAAVVQRELLPGTFTPPPGVEVLAHTEACRHVGGDVYDLAALPEGTLVMVGDVAGKGVPAALMASSLQAAVRVLARGCHDLSVLAQQLHQHLLATTPDNKFATLFLASLQASGELEYVSAGHNPVVVAAPDGSTTLLGASGPPLGLLPASSYASRRITLVPGALLLAYTDGFSEAPALGTEEDFGVERLVELAVRLRLAPLSEIADALFDAVQAHTGGLPPHDDRTVLLLRRES